MNFRFSLLPSTDSTSQKMPVFRIRGMCHITIIVIRKVHQLHLKESLAGKPTSPSGRKLKPANYKPKIEKHIARIANAVRVTLWLSLAFFLVKRKARKQNYSRYLFENCIFATAGPRMVQLQEILSNIIIDTSSTLIFVTFILIIHYISTVLWL